MDTPQDALHQLTEGHTRIAPAQAWWPHWQKQTVGEGIGLHLCDLIGKGMAAVRMSLNVTGALTDQPAGLDTTLLPAMLSATAGRDTDQTTLAWQRLGAKVTPSATADALDVTITVPVIYLPAAIELLGETLREPALRDADIRYVIDTARSRAREAAEQTTTVALSSFYQAVYAPGCPHRDAANADPQALTRIEPDTVRATAIRVTGPANVGFIAAADPAVIDVSEALHKALAGWTTPAAPAPRATPILATDVPRHIVVPTRSRQNAVLAGRTALIPSIRAAVALEVAVTAMGGWDRSILNTVLRQAMGLTYRVESSFAMRPADGGSLCETYIIAAVAPDDIARTAAVITDEFRRYADEGLPAALIDGTINFLVRSQVVQMQTGGQIAGRLATYLQHGHGPDFGRTRAEVMLSLDAAEVSAAATLLHPDRIVLVAAHNPDAHNSQARSEVTR